MLAIWKLIGRASASTAPVLITGETGTGKELVARAIHAYSPRARKPFVAVNQAALPPTLIESELFGHERGAFTGAVARRSGRFEAAAGGTLFLDEIGDLDPSLQSKLLRVVQEGTYERVGGNDPITGDVRIIAATNRPVRPGAAGVTLREELYYRLAVIEIELPPLRARRSDIPLLVAHALRGKGARAVSEAAMQRLVANPWPGNVRELFHVLERAAVLCAGEVIDVGDLPDGLRADAAPPQRRRWTTTIFRCTARWRGWRSNSSCARSNARREIVRRRRACSASAGRSSTPSWKSTASADPAATVPTDTYGLSRGGNGARLGAHGTVAARVQIRA